MTTAQPKVSIIIVNYNGYDDTKECMESISSLDYPNCQVVIVDNASEDGSVEKLQNEFPDVEYVISEENLGYTGGNNLGIEKAVSVGAHYLFILNNDTTVASDVISILVSYMETHPGTGMAGPLILGYEDPDIIHFAGGDVNRNTGLLTMFQRGQPGYAVSEKEIHCSFIEGSAMFVRTDIMNRVGGFNDLYFLCSEEAELCVKIKDLGYDIVVVTDAIIRHKVSKSMQAGSVLWGYFLFRNKLYFIRNNAKDIRLRDIMDVLKYYVVSFASLVLKKRNYLAARGLLLGVYGFLSKQTGKGRYQGKI